MKRKLLVFIGIATIGCFAITLSGGSLTPSAYDDHMMAHTIFGTLTVICALAFMFVYLVDRSLFERTK